jgi:uncharacterized RDD family membrane protein YckC
MPVPLAAPWKRGAAFLLDLAMAAPLATLSPPAAVGVFVLAGTLFEASPWQASAGKRWLGLRVMQAQGRRVTIARAAARHALRAVPVALLALDLPVEAATAFALLGIPALAGRDRRTLWDRLAATTVFALPLGFPAHPPHRANPSS